MRGKAKNNPLMIAGGVIKRGLVTAVALPVGISQAVGSALTSKDKGTRFAGAIMAVGVLTMPIWGNYFIIKDAITGGDLFDD